MDRQAASVGVKKRVGRTRNPVPADALGLLQPGESLDSAVVLPDGGYLLAVRNAPGNDLCSAVIWRQVGGFRTLYALGRAPQISPDGSTVMYAEVIKVDTANTPRCAAVDAVSKPMNSHTIELVPIRPVTAGNVGTFLWSPNRRWAIEFLGEDAGAIAGTAVIEPDNRVALPVAISDAPNSELTRRSGTP